MKIDHLLTIHAPIDRVWPVLQQPELVVDALPGVTLTSIEGEDFTGQMSVGLGPMRLNYGGEGILRYDESARAIHIDARGSEAKGAGNAAAVVDVSVTDGADESTRLSVAIDLDLQGKPAQFGRGILAEVVTRLATQFGKNLEKQVLTGPATPDASAPGQPVATGTSPAQTPVTAPSAPAPARALSGLSPLRQLAGVAVGVVVGAAVAGVLGRSRGPRVTLVVLGTDDPSWVELAREAIRS